ncbi:MAG: 3-dehydroquinate synthase [Lentisphaerae bacterium]|nr:3-dehydroquinate synthase [Lentisphaerota bacterium]
MARVVHVDLGERGYAIRIGRDITPGETLDARAARRVLLVSDSNVEPLYGERCRRALAGRGQETVTAVVKAGEDSKSIENVKSLCEKAAAAGLDRSCAVLALGGGMVGDLAGFAAAVFLRGVKLVQAPTSLLAMVDSSVGGKTAINLSAGKNLVGAFHQPVEVTADLDVLATLPEREYVSGLAEVVKYGIIWDAVLFETLEKQAEAVLKRDASLLEDIVARCCAIKAEIVAMDEHENGVRSILNFGHTLGHAIETVAGYGRLLHGEAVALGAAYAARVSRAEKGLPEEAARRIVGLLERFGLPASLNAAGLGAASWEPVRRAMAADKKTRGGLPRFVLAESVGSVVFGCEVGEETLAKAFEGLRES